MRDLYLVIDGEEFEFAVGDHDDDDAGHCRMVVSLNSVSKLQALSKQGKVEARLVERTGNQDVPVAGHRALRVVSATSNRAAAFLDATLVGGGEATAEIEEHPRARSSPQGSPRPPPLPRK